MGYPFKRYDLVPPTSGMEEREDGEWVKLFDHLKAVSEIAMLRAELAMETDATANIRENLEKEKQSNAELRQALAEAKEVNKRFTKVCCRKCDPDFVGRIMFLCPTCGNKRCPKATDHTLACTNSNEPGQPGSDYV